MKRRIFQSHAGVLIILLTVVAGLNLYWAGSRRSLAQ